MNDYGVTCVKSTKDAQNRYGKKVLIATINPEKKQVEKELPYENVEFHSVYSNKSLLAEILELNIFN